MSKPSSRKELQALKNLISETDLILSITNLPENRTVRCRELLGTALARADDLLKRERVNPAVILGHKGGSTTSKRHGPEHYRMRAAQRKTRAGRKAA